MSSLNDKLINALESREIRNIRRRLPEPISSAQSSPIDFNSNDYLSLSHSTTLRDLFLSKLRRGSRLLVNGSSHSAFGARLATFFQSKGALLFNSGFDANVALFTCLPQTGDVIVHDEYIHASVIDGIRASRSRIHCSFAHNSVLALKKLLSELKDDRISLASGNISVFVAVESLYSMDGTFAPLPDIVDALEVLFPRGNAYLIVDEAHTTGIYGPKGRGLVAMFSLEDKVLVRLHTFGKALAATGAVIVTNTLIRDYLLNYARPLIYTTSLSHSNVIAADCSFGMLEDGRAQLLADKVLEPSRYLCRILRPRLVTIPAHILSLPPHLEEEFSERLQSSIIPIMTSQPRPVSAFLYTRELNARPITWPTVPKGKDRIRVCLHAGNTRLEVDRLVDAMIEWAEGAMGKTTIRSVLKSNL